MMSLRELLPIGLITVAFLVGGLLYTHVPDSIPSHWNAAGEIDGWSSKNFGVFFFPSMAFGIYMIMTFIPLIDPLKKNYASFARPYYWFRTLMVLFFVLLYFYTLWAALGAPPRINNFIMPAISILFIVIGFFLPNVKKNYFVGIRTPWTLHSEAVWDKTHQFSGKLFVLAGVIALLSSTIPAYAYPIVVISIVSAAITSVLYSYYIFRKIEGRDRSDNNTI